MIKKEPAILGGKPVRSEFLIFGAPLIEQAVIDEVVACLRSGWLSTGPRTEMFEEQFARFVGAKYAIGVNSCTAAMHLCLYVNKIGEGDEVITSPMTFCATANVIVHQRARPVFVDISLDDYNIDPEKIEAAITPKTRAIMPVHLAGYPCKMDEIMEIAKRHNLVVIEDAAHAISAEYKGKKIGSIGHYTSFSFYVTKNISTGEGGMITTDIEDHVEELKILRLFGLSRDAWKRYAATGYRIHYDVLDAGYKYNMMDIQAALGIPQLARIEEYQRRREEIAAFYTEAFKDMEEIIIPPLPKEGIKHAWHLYSILIRPERLKINRDQFAEALRAENIGTGIHFVSLHLHSFYKKHFGYKRGDFPNAEFVSDRTLSLPLSPKLTKKDAEDVVEAVKKLVEYFKI